MNSTFSSIDEYNKHVVEKLRLDLEARNRQDRLLADMGALYKAKGVLVVDKVDFVAKENGKAHRTERFELVHRTPPSPVLRRGQPFDLSIRFQGDQSFDPAKDTLRLLFNYGPNPSPTQHTQGILDVTGTDEFTKDKHDWDVLVKSTSEASINLQVQIPPDVPVGIWKCQIRTGSKDDETKIKLYDCADDIYILFNPWCPEDTTHMEDTDLLNEYVLADVGKVWTGPEGSSRGRQWVYGQFDHAALPVAVYLLEQSGLSHATRCNPVLISRAIVKLLNSNDDDDGVLEGNWTGNYKGGVAPTAWTGSVKILEEYLLTRKSVKYGQCYVLSGVFTTICRALGIPARPVTNLISAHDANGTLTVDRYYDSQGNELDRDPFHPDGTKDSIWNFHVWGEAWMARPDLPKGYGGWQALDATPQERSGGFFQCGPASVEAVRRGQVGLAYDVPFVLAEVNADLVRWKEDKSSQIGFVKLDCNRYQIGRRIVTKKPNVFDPTGESDADDITLNYKSAEGSQEERLSLFNAVRGSTRAKSFFEMPGDASEDVEFKLVELERVPVGDPFSVVVEVKNKSDSVRTVDTVLSAVSVYYTGNKACIVKKGNGQFVLKPNTTDSLKMTIKPEEYMEKIVDHGIMKLQAMATVRETKQAWADEDDFQVLTPDLNIKASGDAVVGKPLEITCSFTNPLNMALTDCKLNYEGPGITRPGTFVSKDIPAKANASIKLTVVPRLAGEHKFVAAFDSKELVDITGSLVINVAKA